MSGDTALIIALFGGFVLLLLVGVPVAWALGGLSLLATAVAELFLEDSLLDFNSFSLAVERVFDLVSKDLLVALPMFIFMGHMLDRSEVARDLMESAQEVLGSLRGGLALSVTAIGVVLAASTGIIGASVVLLGILALPTMLKQGYRPELAVGTVCGAGTLGILIPPSIMLIIMADRLQLSVGDLFWGAVGPGLLLALLYAVYIVAYAALKPAVAPLAPGPRAPLAGSFRRLAVALVPPLSLVFVVLGSIFFGVATPTEASGLGAAGAVLLAAARRRLGAGVFRGVLDESMKTTGFLFAIFIGATCFGLALRLLGCDDLIAGLFDRLDLPPYGVVGLILAVIFVLGFFLDWIEITLIILPLVAGAVAGLDLAWAEGSTVEKAGLVWFAILCAVTLQTSFLTPPVGFALFYIKGVCPPGVTLGHIYRGAVPYILLQLLALLLVLCFPDLVLWLPAFAYDPPAAAPP